MKKNLEISAGETATYLWGKSNQVTGNFSLKTLKARRKQYIFQILKEKNCQFRTPHPVKIAIRNEEEIETSQINEGICLFVCLFMIVVVILFLVRRPHIKGWLKKVL